MIAFGSDRPRRRPNLTPMIDVVFLLLVFFMIASRFGTEDALPLTAAAGGGAYSGPPRLVEFGPAGVTLNGVAVVADGLAEALSPLMNGPEDVIILRARDGADLQALVALMEVLRAAGLTHLVLVE